uniref:Reverse transcriptase domain-containing protein n=1 Tax=Tanacetum cinerariifolium TaxID=118510 RepID=A0A6L2KN36_TANCI|nr:hypothetical protein [Tanacetum cinerariifolium]
MKFLENLKKLYINLPFIEALAQIPKYARFLKGLLTNRAILKEACTITMNERCSAVLLNKLQLKEKDPESITIPCDIGQLHINNALADLRASISLMPYTMYEKLGLGGIKATRMSLELADRLIQYPGGIIKNKDHFCYRSSNDRCIQQKDDAKGRDDDVIFDVDQSIKRPPTKDDECYRIDDLDGTINAEAQELLANVEPDSVDDFDDAINAKAQELLANDMSDLFLLKGLKKAINQSDLESCKSSEYEVVDNSDSREPIRRIESINTPYLVATKLAESNKVKKYAYLHGDKSFPIIISSKMSKKEKMSLLQALEKRKGAIAWKMSDIKEISLSYYTHKILGEDDYKPVIQPQRRLNLKVQDVVKNEIMKLLDSGLIYPISDSLWVSPIHVVPKKGGMTIVLNDNNELILSRTVTGWRVCIDYHKLNDAIRKDHFPTPFIDQMLERLYNDSDSDEPIWRMVSINTLYPAMQETAKPVEVKREYLYSASANEIDEKKPELKDMPHHLEYAYLYRDKSFPIIISSKLFRYLRYARRLKSSYNFRKTIFCYRSSNDRCIQQKDDAKGRDDDVVFDVDQSIKRPPTKDDECYRIDDLDGTINAEAQELLANVEPDSFLSQRAGEIN